MKPRKRNVSSELEEKITNYFEEAQKSSSPEENGIPNSAQINNSVDQDANTDDAPIHASVEQNVNVNDAQKNFLVEQDSNFEADKVYERIQNTISNKENANRYPFGFFKAVAAVLFLALTSVGFFYYYLDGSQTQMAMKETQAAQGTLTRLNLPDGTEIWLNAGSKITFPSRFANDKREVSLDGEAFFKVKHDEKRPFLIHTQNLITQVLGTSFNVNSYSQDNQIKVTVLSGKVAIYEQKKEGQENSAKPLFLIANQQGVYLKKHKNFLMNKKDVKSLEAVAWKEGNLIFKDTELSEVIRNLERRYAIQIEMDHSLSCPVTVNFNNEPLENVMRVLAKLVNGKVTYQNGRYQLTGVVC